MLLVWDWNRLKREYLQMPLKLSCQNWLHEIKLLKKWICSWQCFFFLLLHAFFHFFSLLIDFFLCSLDMFTTVNLWWNWIMCRDKSKKCTQYPCNWWRFFIKFNNLQSTTIIPLSIFNSKQHNKHYYQRDQQLPVQYLLQYEWYLQYWMP